MRDLAAELCPLFPDANFFRLFSSFAQSCHPQLTDTNTNIKEDGTFFPKDGHWLGWLLVPGRKP
jgi:hypothetical protein